MQLLAQADDDEQPPPPQPRADLEEALAQPRVLPEVKPTAAPVDTPAAPAPAAPAPRPIAPPPASDGGSIEDVVREIALAEGATYRPAASLFRDFAIRCRQQRTLHGVERIGAAGEAADAGEGTDFHAVANNYASVTPLQIDLTHTGQLSMIQDWMK